MAKRVKTNYDRGYVNAMDKIRVFIESSSKVMYVDALAKNWREHDYSFEGRDVLPNGDEVWICTTLELGLPVLWVKHPDGSFDYRVLHTPGYDESTGEHWCWNCHCQMIHHDDEWLCPKCGDHIDDNDIDLLSSPTEEASYPDDDLEPEPEWYD